MRAGLVGMRGAVALGALWFALSIAGCSAFFVRPAKTSVDPRYNPRCTSSKALPGVDVLIGVAQAAGAVFVLATPTTAFDNGIGKGGVAGIDAVAAAILFGSSAYGFSAVEECRELKRQYGDLDEPAPRPRQRGRNGHDVQPYVPPPYEPPPPASLPRPPAMVSPDAGATDEPSPDASRGPPVPQRFDPE